MVMKVTLSSDDWIQRIAFAIKNLTKLQKDNDAQVAALMHRLELQNSFVKENQENVGSSKAKDLEVQESQKKQDMHDRIVIRNVLHDTTQLFISSPSIQQLQLMITDTIHAPYGGSFHWFMLSPIVS